jgi:transposase
VNGSLFRAWVEQHLTRELRKGDLVVMDNLSAHTVKGIDEALRGRGASVRYLPPYPPDFSPIENALSKLKHLLRSAGERTFDALWNTVGRVLDHFPAAECLRYIRHAGYGVRTQHFTSR